MKKLLVICGPTATGKTSLALGLAKKLSSKGRPASGWNGELVSADSRQVYKGMDIGTGKDLPVISNFQFPISKFRKLNLGCYLLDKIPVWLLDIVEPDEEFNVAKYYQLACPVIKGIWKKGKLPVIVGGTGFYIKAIIDGIESLGIEPDWELREKLSNLEIEQLREKLKRLDPERWQSMNKSDRQNPRRLIRAIEIATASKQQTVDSRQLNTERCKLDALFIGLTAPRKILYRRIDKRVEERVEQGIEKEIRKLLKKGYDWESSVLGKTLGYQEWRPFFEEKASKEEAIQCWKFAEHAYARRQLTWFKRDPRIHWIDITKQDWKEEVELLVKRWYNS